MKESFAPTIAYLFSPACEGFESTLSGDVGGDTIAGVSSHWYPETFAAMKAKLQQGDKAGALQIATAFYHDRYWVPEGCDDLSSPLDKMVFVEAVNTEGADCHHTRAIAVQTGTPGGFLTAMDAHYRAIVASKPADAKFLGAWEGRLKRLAAWCGVSWSPNG